ncbi:kallikrein-1 [Talpa occidentalis]|uniref:kallikrein-1 n=1 Tax=Talpa occidentalis TaxID=50954 RepID=UPI0018903366|nr:kallikrein-1 [Talpa occidentalis]
MRVLVLCLVLALEGSGAAPPVQSRVVGGKECDSHSQPWQAAVYHYSTFECGGVLVHPQWVLTAAHCMNDHFQVWLGRHNLLEDESTVQFFTVTKSFPHPKFNMSLLQNTFISPEDDLSHDLLMLRLSQPAQLTDAVKVLDLPTKEPRVGSACKASGWGTIKPDSYFYPDTLQCVDLKLLSIDICKNAHKQKVTDTMLCVGDMAGVKDTCRGDSGGPLICDGELQGVTSWGHFPCGKPKVPSIYTKVIDYIPWIKKIMADNP